MHTKLHALTATILGSLFAASPAIAQSADQDRYQQQQQAQQEAQARQAQQAQQAQQPQNNGARIATRTGPTCPVGCVPAPTGAQRAARRARVSQAELRRREEEAFAQQQADAQALAERERLDRERTEQERVTRERADRERMDRERMDRETAERERLERERADMEAAPVIPEPVAQARGGGPEMFRPRLVLGLDTQVAGYSGGYGDAVQPGPLVGLRGGVALGNWFEIEGRGFYMNNHGVRHSLGEGVSQNTWATAGVVRLNIPLPVIHPYIFSGIGVLHTTASQIGVDNNGSVNTPLINNTAGFVPMGGGVNFALHRDWQLGAEGGYNYIWDHTGFATNPALNVNGFWQTGLVLRYLM